MKNDLTSLKKKKVELVKQAKQDQKKFAKLKQEKDKEIKERVLTFESGLSGALYQIISAYQRPVIRRDHYCSEVYLGKLD